MMSCVMMTWDVRPCREIINSDPTYSSIFEHEGTGERIQDQEGNQSITSYQANILTRTSIHHNITTAVDDHVHVQVHVLLKVNCTFEED